MPKVGRDINADSWLRCDKYLFGFFGNYLVNHARKQQDASKGELKYGTLVNYFSGVKTWLQG